MKTFKVVPRLVIQSGPPIVSERRQYDFGVWWLTNLAGGNWRVTWDAPSMRLYAVRGSEQITLALISDRRDVQNALFAWPQLQSVEGLHSILLNYVPINDQMVKNRLQLAWKGSESQSVYDLWLEKIWHSERIYNPSVRAELVREAISGLHKGA